MIKNILFTILILFTFPLGFSEEIIDPFAEVDYNMDSISTESEIQDNSNIFISDETSPDLEILEVPIQDNNLVYENLVDSESPIVLEKSSTLNSLIKTNKQTIFFIIGIVFFIVFFFIYRYSVDEK